MAVSNDTMGFSDRVLKQRREKVTEFNSFNDKRSLVTFPKQSMYLNKLASLRDSLLNEQRKKLLNHLQRFQIEQKLTEQQMEKVRCEHQSRILKLSRKSPMLFERFDHIRFEHPSQLAPLTTIVEGRNITGGSQPFKPFFPKRKKQAAKLNIQETVKQNLPRLPQNQNKIQPTLPLALDNKGHLEQSAVRCQPLSRKLAPRSKQVRFVSSKSRLCPLMTCTPRDKNIEGVKFEPVPDGDRMNMDKHFTECLTLYKNEDSRHQSLNLSKVKRCITKQQQGLNMVLNRQKIKSPPRLPKIIYKSDSMISVLNNADDGCQCGTDMSTHPRKQVMVCMPDIVLDSASPVPVESREASPIGSLRKTLKQSEIRQKEIKNLLEDVKELNKRTQIGV